jgi:anaphase-promoting complex subunit 1
VQSASLVGLGLLHRQSAARPVVELLLAELGERLPAGGGGGGAAPVPPVRAALAAAEGREGHCLCAGIALGLVLLAKGRSAAHLADLRLEASLGRLMRGGGGGGGGGGGIGGAPTPPPQAHAAGLLLESRGWDSLGVTAPGAAVALALMHLDSGDAAVSALFAPPDSHCALQRVRPDLLLTRALGRALVHFTDIRPSRTWLAQQLPPMLRSHALRLAPIVAGSAEAAAEAAEAAEPLPGACRSRAAPREMDAEDMSCAALQITAGALMALGLRYAGSGDAAASALLHAHATALLDVKSAAGSSGAAGASSGGPDRLTAELALCVCAMALGAVHAGGGDLATLRLLRRLRRRIEPSPGAASGITHGSHGAVALAAGWLFLGAGALSFGRGPAATACLLAAMLPPFPSSLTDQRGHLAALRHLYVLASEPRLLRPLDAVSGQPTRAELAFIKIHAPNV